MFKQASTLSYSVSRNTKPTSSIQIPSSTTGILDHCRNICNNRRRWVRIPLY